MARLLVGMLFVMAVVLLLGGHMLSGRSPSSPEGQEPPGKRQRDQFAADRAPDPGARGGFSPQRALGYLEELCRIGPRVSGTEGMKQQQEYLRKHFEALGAKVTFQRFPAQQVSRPGQVEMANLVVSWHPEQLRRVLLCAHYDTRPIADQEPDPRKWRQPFLSANDGGSGVALLMELAHQMKDLKTRVGVDFVLFDGEEYIFDPQRDKYFFGSEYFADDYQRGRAKHRYGAGILLDMIAGKDAKFPIEWNSWLAAAPLAQEVWKIAAEEKCDAFVHGDFGEPVNDDHIALNRAGIRTIDIIDFKYPHWHRLTDTPDNCSAERLGQVARVLTVWLQRTK